MPEPEELLASEAPPQQGPRAGFEESTWFRINVGRRHNADPRWLLPLLCRRGHVSRSEIGAIRILGNESRFEVPTAIASRFLAAVRRTATEDDGVEIILAEDNSPGEAARKPHRGKDRDAKRSGPPRDRNFKHRKKMNKQNG